LRWPEPGAAGHFTTETTEITEIEQPVDLV